MISDMQTEKRRVFLMQGNGWFNKIGTMAIALTAIMACIALNPGLTWGKSYPAKEISLFVGVPPGGTLDISGRIIAKVLSKMWGQQVLIVNKPGGTQTVSFSYVMNSKPDGYSLAYILQPYLTMKKLEEPSLPYTPENFTWLGAIARSTLVLTVRGDSPWKTYEDFIDYAVKRGGKIVFGNDGAGGLQHLFLNQFAEKVGIKNFTQVPFQGGGPAVQALLGDHVQAIAPSTGPTASYIKSGDVRYLVFFGQKRDSSYPNVPTIKEKGMEHFGGSQAMFAGPKDLPSEVADKISKSIKEAMESQEIKDIFTKIGWEYEYYPPQECLKIWKAEEKMYGREMKKYGFIK
jgi:tripartite-type tricarboxylate transporter receptor subunit TctC